VGREWKDGGELVRERESGVKFPMCDTNPRIAGEHTIKSLETNHRNEMIN
jgi:hypothetical protein